MHLRQFNVKFIRAIIVCQDNGIIYLSGTESNSSAVGGMHLGE